MDEWKIIRERRTGYGQRRRMRSSQDIYESFKEHFARLDREHFVVLLLDAKNTMLGFHTVSIGSLTSSLVHPREVYKFLVLYNDVSTAANRKRLPPSVRMASVPPLRP